MVANKSRIPAAATFDRTGSDRMGLAKKSLSVSWQAGGPEMAPNISCRVAWESASWQDLSNEKKEKYAHLLEDRHCS